MCGCSKMILLCVFTPIYGEGGERSLARFTCVASVGLKDTLVRSCCVFLLLAAKRDSQGFLSFVLVSGHCLATRGSLKGVNDAS